MSTQTSVIEKKPVSSLLRTMNIGDEEIYPVSQLTSLRTTTYQLLLMKGLRFSIKHLSGRLIITRIS